LTRDDVGPGMAASPDEDEVIVVDAADVPTGTMGKLAAHREGVRHRAVSVVVYRPDGDMLLQQRAQGKYHSPGRWSNSCCGHPRPGETTLGAARRRLREELGLDCALRHAATLEYRATVGEGLVEHEIDHVFVGLCDGEPVANPEEVGAWRWAPADAVMAELEAHPERYTPWCALVLRAVEGESAEAGDGRTPVDRLAG
jgi:isopentenyl-diphosphate Delta-isomerase